MCEASQGYKGTLHIEDRVPHAVGPYLLRNELPQLGIRHIAFLRFMIQGGSESKVASQSAVDNNFAPSWERRGGWGGELKTEKRRPSIKVRGGANRVMYDNERTGTHKKAPNQRGNLKMRHETDAFQDRMMGRPKRAGRI